MKSSRNMLNLNHKKSKKIMLLQQWDRININTRELKLLLRLKFDRAKMEIT